MEKKCSSQTVLKAAVFFLFVFEKRRLSGQVSRPQWEEMLMKADPDWVHFSESS